MTGCSALPLFWPHQNTKKTNKKVVLFAKNNCNNNINLLISFTVPHVATVYEVVK